MLEGTSYSFVVYKGDSKIEILLNGTRYTYQILRVFKVVLTRSVPFLGEYTKD